MGAGSRSHDHSGTAAIEGFLAPLRLPTFPCAISPGRSRQLFLPLSVVPSRCRHTTPPPSPLPPPSINSHRAFKKHKAPHSSRSITSPLSAERGHHYYCMSSFSVPPSRSVHPALFSALVGATVITALGDSGPAGRGGVASLTARSSGSITRLHF